jgi:uncharacterized linocin/CFP29 family protein
MSKSGDEKNKDGGGDSGVGPWPLDDLHRHLAPISARAWKEIQSTATEVLTVNLAARKLVDFRGPLGWQKSAVGLGTVEQLMPPPVEGVAAARRQVQPLTELRAGFTLARAELDRIDRGGHAPDLTPLTEAATRLARAEDRAVFHGYPPGAIAGIRVSGAEVARHGAGSAGYPSLLAEAVRRLRTAGVGGPYGMAAGDACFTELHSATARDGFLLLDAVKQILGGPIVWAPAVDGAVVVSMRGGDFRLTVGRDIAIGYLGHTATSVELYLEESFTFEVLAPEAAIWLRLE